MYFLLQLTIFCICFKHFNIEYKVLMDFHYDAFRHVHHCTLFMPFPMAPSCSSSPLTPYFFPHSLSSIFASF